jgi:uncharacterized ferritin-like protein (DUF455 family)
MLNERLKELNSFYGEFPIQNKLWQNCLNTKENLIARICVISLVQECRGLDAGPRLVHKLKSLGDAKSSEIMQKIVNDEVNHVRVGLKWFKKFIDFEIQNKKKFINEEKKTEEINLNFINKIEIEHRDIKDLNEKEMFFDMIKQEEFYKTINNTDEIYYFYYKDICDKYLTSAILPPFNKDLRNLAGIPDTWFIEKNKKLKI